MNILNLQLFNYLILNLKKCKYCEIIYYKLSENLN